LSKHTFSQKRIFHIPVISIVTICCQISKAWEILAIKVAGSIIDKVTGIFDWPDPSICTMALVSTQPQAEMNTRNLPGKGQPACKADNLTAICELIV
jgi:hypothetical protein